MNGDTAAYRPIFCSLRTINIVSVVKRSGQTPHRSSGNSRLALR